MALCGTGFFSISRASPNAWTPTPSLKEFLKARPMSTNATCALFDDVFLKKLEHLSFVSKRLLTASLMAERKSQKRGSGLEFADYRAYVAGDDFRYLDWKAYL